MSPKLLAATLSACFLFSGAALADEKPPANAKRLSDIVQSLEAQGFAPIVEVEFDDGLWEVKAYKASQKRRVKVDPVSGDTRSDRADD